MAWHFSMDSLRSRAAAYNTSQRLVEARDSSGGGRLRPGEKDGRSVQSVASGSPGWEERSAHSAARFPVRFAGPPPRICGAVFPSCRFTETPDVQALFISFLRFLPRRLLFHLAGTDLSATGRRPQCRSTSTTTLALYQPETTATVLQALFQ